MQSPFRLLALVGILALLSPVGDASQSADSALRPDPFVGIWVLDASKSDFTGLPPKSEFRTFSAGPDGMMLCTILTTTHEGRGSFAFWQVKPDGSESGEYSNAGGGAPVRMLQMKRVDPYTIEILVRYLKDTPLKREGILSAKGSFVVSRDGKTLTYSVVNTTPDGVETRNVRFFVKQP